MVWFIYIVHPPSPTRPKYNPMPSGDERSDRILLNQRTTGHTLSEGGWSPFAPLLLNVGNSKSTAAVQVPKERPRYKRVAQARGLTTDDDDFCQPKGIRWTYIGGRVSEIVNNTSSRVRWTFFVATHQIEYFYMGTLYWQFIREDNLSSSPPLSTQLNAQGDPSGGPQFKSIILP